MRIARQIEIEYVFCVFSIDPLNDIYNSYTRVFYTNSSQ